MRLADIVNSDEFVSKHGKSNHQLWTELCELISKNPQDMKLVKTVEMWRVKSAGVAFQELLKTMFFTKDVALNTVPILFTLWEMRE